MRTLLLALLVSVGFAATPATSQEPQQITVFAAASLTNTLEEIASIYAEKNGTRPKLSFASSSTLAKQIEAGAGAQIFISADEAWMDYLQTRDLIAVDTRKSLLGNGLVLVAPSDQSLDIEITNDASWFAKLPEGRIAVGDPEHVPAGKYAKESLTNLGAWDAAEPRLARADNVRNALVLVERGEAVAGIVYSTDAAISKSVRVAGKFPEGSHKPISYPIALLRGQDSGEARKFYDFLISEEAHPIFTKYGFSVR